MDLRTSMTNLHPWLGHPYALSGAFLLGKIIVDKDLYFRLVLPSKVVAVNPLNERVIWTDYQNPISHNREVGFLVLT
jgi:hypothetical protein